MKKICEIYRAKIDKKYIKAIIEIDGETVFVLTIKDDINEIVYLQMIMNTYEECVRVINTYIELQGKEERREYERKHNIHGNFVH